MMDSKLTFPVIGLCVGILVSCLAFPLGLYLQYIAYEMGYGTSGRFFWLISNLEWFLIIVGIIIGTVNGIILLFSMKKGKSD